MVRQSSLSLERYRVRVESKFDPTGTAPRFALVASGEPDPGDWAAGTWDADGHDGAAAYAISPTISGTDGGATIAVADGCWNLWVEATGDAGELPKKRIPTTIDIY